MALMEMNAPNIAEIGTPDGMFELGLMHCTGRDAALDLVTAHKWFNLAALQGNQDAKRYRMEIAREMSKAEIAEAQRQAREWLGRH
jgi:TPR repeat protein